MSPASHTTESPLLRDAAGTRSSVPSGRRRRPGSLNASAKGLGLRLTATFAIASAKLAKITVRTASCDAPVEEAGLAIDSTNVTTVPRARRTSLGSSLGRGVELLERIEEGWRRISRSKRLRDCATPCAEVAEAPVGRSTERSLVF